MRGLAAPEEGRPGARLARHVARGIGGCRRHGVWHGV